MICVNSANDSREEANEGRALKPNCKKSRTFHHELGNPNGAIFYYKLEYSLGPRPLLLEKIANLGITSPHLRGATLGVSSHPLAFGTF